jgi:hypothetical protein
LLKVHSFEGVIHVYQRYLWEEWVLLVPGFGWAASDVIG